MDNIPLKTIWKEKSTGRVVQVLDVGVWILDVKDRLRQTIDIDKFVDDFEYLPISYKEIKNG